MSAESPRHMRCGVPPLVVPPQPPSERSIIDALSGFINDVTLSSTGNTDPKDVIQWARFETADINEPVPEGEGDNDVSPLILILGYGSGVQVWLIPPNGEAQEVLSWRQGTVRVLRILPTPQHGDCFASKRPLIALCDSASPGPTFCSLSFISIRGGEQVKSIKFKNPILDVLANKRSIVVSFSERFAVFDAATLEDRMAITTCYPCPCPLGGNTIVNPLALGEKWLAFADRKLNPTKRSGGGCEGEGVTSYTATVLHAAKSLSKGLRGLGESVAQSLAGARGSQSPSPPHDAPVPGLITVLDIEGIDEDECQDDEPYDPIVAHFVAHSEAVIAMKFDASGMLLVTADRRGHDFHVFRINPHPCGPSQASVHHLYVLHRGDTTAKVQDIAISVDSRWAAISTLRGTTHVFAMSPYGGWCGVRTHTSPRVVNRLSRFHRSAGLPIPAANDHHPKVSEGIAHGAWFPNPRLPPYPSPTVTTPLAQLRPTANLPTHTITRTSSGRQRLSSLSEEASAAPLLARAWLGAVPGACPPPAPPARPAPVASLYLMSASGSLTHLLLHPRPARNIPKEKVCDESAIELEVTPRAQWALQRGPGELVVPLPPSNPLAHSRAAPRMSAEMCMSSEERWLSQVEIVTHAGPHRRLWMGPQFLFKTFNFTGSSSSLSEAETVEVEATGRPAARSNPVNMPCVRPIVPVLVDSGSASSLEQSPCEGFRRKSLLAESGRAASLCDVQLKEDLAEAMKEDHGREVGSSGGGGASVSRCVGPRGTVVSCGVGGPSGPSEACGPTPPARRLPAGTTIPAQPAAGRPPSPPALPLPLLDTHVLIPAALLPHPDSCQQDSDCDITLPRAEDDIHPTPRLKDKKSPTQNVSDKVVAEPKPEPKSSNSSAMKDDPSDESKHAKDSDRYCEKVVESKKEVEVQIPKDNEIVKDTKSRISKSKNIDIPKDTKPKSSNAKDSFKEIPLKDEVKKESSVSKDEHSITVSLPLPSKKQTLESMSSESYEEIKTEEQAWDMLLNEPEKPAVLNLSKSVDNEKEVDDTKPKSKKNKQKKALEAAQSKSEEDSFVEIHAIEDKPPKPSSELVSIPDPLDEKHVDSNPATSTYASRSKKSRTSKSVTPEVNREENAPAKQEKQFEKKCESDKVEKSDFETAISLETHISLKPKAYSRKKYSTDFPAASSFHETPTTLVEPIKTCKSKSLSPIPDPRQSSDAVQKDVYVIDTTEMNFPDIKVTKGLKSQKNLKSPQPAARKTLEKETLIEKPIKSWSTIAATKKTDEVEATEELTFQIDDDTPTIKKDLGDKLLSDLSLQEKLMQLCKRTDIIVAECDMPSGLRFVDEHHTMLQELPPLEPLDFGLDDFKLEVMRDSLLEVDDRKITSPICKINIDDILSSIKENTSKVPESCSAFNLIDLERVPAKKERGFSVIENDKITSQDVKVDAENIRVEEKEEVMDKSSDDDVTSPVVSTDSDKDDKKNTGASNAVPPSLKQSAKPKKSRRKKK